ncbi:MAG TPA: ATP-binding protein [Ignavibacteria bacterium]|nr:ATP-binding protein [Ignavibacteria bacterium]
MVIGIVSGYFLLHPITMVIYWFETSNSDVTLQNVLQAFSERFIHAFYLHMMPMSLVFTIIGGITGLGSGLYFRKIQKQGHKIQMQQQQLNESIRSIIKNGENENVEFKKSFRYDYRIGHPDKSLEDIVMKSVAGFMNANGGILVIGVDYNGHVNGLADDYFSLGRKSREGYEKRFMEVLASKLGTDLCSLAHLAFHEIADKEICSVLIVKANRPVYMREGENTIFYLRTGNVTKPLNTQETVEYLKIQVLKV